MVIVFYLMYTKTKLNSVTPIRIANFLSIYVIYIYTNISN